MVQTGGAGHDNLDIIGKKLEIIYSQDDASAELQRIQLDRATTSDNDEVYTSYYFDHDGSVTSQGEVEFARQTVIATDVTEDSEDAKIEFDLMVGGSFVSVFTIGSTKIENDRTAFFNSGARIPIDEVMSLNSTGYPIFGAHSDGNQTDATIFSLGSTDKSFIISSSSSYTDDHGASVISLTNPTLFVFSATDVGGGTTDEWTSITHDQTDSVISSGKGDIKFSPAGGDTILASDNGSYMRTGSASELITIAVGQMYTTSSANLLPANSFIIGAAVRIVTAPGGGASTLDVGKNTGSQFAYISGMNAAGGTTETTPGSVGTSGGLGENTTADSVQLNTDANVTGSDMEVRVVIYYMQLVSPTS